MAEHVGGWIGVDLDGTLAHYDRWHGHLHIGEPIPSMVGRVKSFLDAGRQVRVFTARMSEHDLHVRTQIELAIGDWTEKHIGVRLFATCVKDFACTCIIDDIAVGVKKNTGELVLG